MLKKRLMVFFVVLALIITVTCGSSFGAPKVYQLKFYTFMDAASMAGKAMIRFGDNVEKSSKGQLKVKVFTSGQLGNDREGVESCRMGTIDVFMGGTGIYSNFYPYTKMFDLPYLFKNSKHAMGIVNSSIGAEIFKEMPKYNLVHLATGDNGMRNISTTNRQINSVSDVKGLKVRVPEIETYVAVWKSWGAIVTPMPLSELYMALKTGVVDAQDNAPYHTLASKVYEVQKYYSMIDYMWMGMTIVANSAKFNSLPNSLQKVLVKEAKNTAQYTLNSIDKDNVVALKEFKKNGIEINYKPDRESFKKGINDFYKKYENEPWYRKDIINRIRTNK
jgi:tripartite ATP-independent transporter DctP family solute receptor